MSFIDGATEVYHRLAAEYDGWFEGSPVFAAELACLKSIRTSLPEPRLEIGVGPGRFAAGLGVGLGVDGAFAPLRFAAGRGIAACQADAAQLPLADGCVGTVYLLFTLCFLRRPERALAEIRRVLAVGGRLAAAIIVADSPWGEAVQAGRAEGHPYYRHARLYTVAEAREMLRAAGLGIVEERSTLLQPPGGRLDGRCLDRIAAGAGCGVLVAGKDA
ncbi:MAG: class I SAM-dependent methyltransferase [Thermodesulfobacteriota bacterium]